MFQFDVSKFRKVEYFGLTLYIDHKFNYLATDSTGYIYAFVHEPVAKVNKDETGFWLTPRENKLHEVMDARLFKIGDWRESSMAIDKSGDQ